MFVEYSIEPLGAFSCKVDDIVKKPKVITVNKFNEESAIKFNEDFSVAIESGQNIIPVVIDSYGGQLYSLMNMIDTIKNSPVAVATIVKGKAMSCGALLLSCGTEGFRFASENSSIMIHELSSGSFGKNEEIQADAKNCKKLNKKIFQILSKNCGHKKGYFEDIYRKQKSRADWYLEPEECIKHNLINHIGIPKIEMTVSASIDLMF